MAGLFDLVVLLAVLGVAAAGFYLVKMIFGFLSGFAFVLIILVVVLFIWVPGFLDPYLGPVQELLYLPILLFQQAFDYMSEAVRIVLGS